MSLEEHIKQIEKKLPGIQEHLKPYSGATWGIHWNAGVEDIDYIETDKYKVAVAKWEQHDWYEEGGGIQWTEWLEFYFENKERPQDDVQKEKINPIVTRDRYEPRKDRQYYWPLNYVSITKAEDNKITVYWHDRDEKEGIRYQFDLDKKEISEKAMKTISGQ